MAERLRPILRVARENRAFVNVDMEQYAHKDLTYAIFREVLSEPEFRDWADVGIVAQAYLPEAEGDLRDDGGVGPRPRARRSRSAWSRGPTGTSRSPMPARWAGRSRSTSRSGRATPASSAAPGSSWSNHERLRPALGSHNIRSLAHAMAAAESLGVPTDAYEVQMLHGMGEPIERALVARGHRVRVYTPYGAMLPGMAYLVRRLLENTSNESFLKASFAGKGPRSKALLRDPEEVGAMLFP